MKPILLDFPQEFNTERLLIRMPKPGDGKVVFDAIQASLPELKPWMPFANKEQTENDVEENIREAYVKFLKREDMRLLVFNKETGEYIASSGLHRINWDVPKFEIGYWITTKHSGKGYMTEAVEGICDFAFKQLKARRLEIRCDSKNYRSKAVAERSGFHLEGVLRYDDITLTGELRDTCVYSKIR